MVVHALMADHPCMEPMRIVVKEIHRDPSKGLLVARIRASSVERLAGVPLADIHVTIHLQDSMRAMNQQELKRMARDEVLRFLDVS